MPDCPFCKIVSKEIKTEILAESELSTAFFDAYPLAEGHALVIPNRHVPNLFHLSQDEQADLWAMVATAQGLVAARNSPDGFNIGVNVGVAAGQTVDHAHIHVIPRYEGDIEDPRGGVRWVIPDKAAYWE